MRVAIHQPHYFPWPKYFDKIAKSDCFVLLDSVDYRKNYFQNRARIKGPHGPEWLTVPVQSAARKSKKLFQIQIADDQRWQQKQLTTLRQYYGKAPYFDSHYKDVAAIIGSPPENLVLLDETGIRWGMSIMGIGTPLVRASDLELPQAQKGQLILEICKKLGATEYLSGPGGKDYIDIDMFEKNTIAVMFHEYSEPEYKQVRSPFTPGLSILDLILNLGPESRAFVGHD